jgi:hypothetical protein
MMTRVMLAALMLLGGCSEYDIHASTDTNNGAGDDDVDPNNGDSKNDPNAEKGGVTGRICAPSQNVYIANAEVWIQFTDGSRISTTTDGDGYFTLDDVPEGIHTVYVSKGSFSTQFEVKIEADTITTLAEEECLEGDINVAVVTGDYDDVGAILDSLGIDYDMYDGTFYGGGQYANLLGNPSKMASYDIIFFNCGMDDSWSYGYGPISLNEIRQNVRQFVQGGGSIYASDWAYFMIEAPFPNMVTFVGNDNTYGNAQVGESGFYTVEVLDPALKSILGSSSATINYDLPAWVVPEKASDSEVLVRGTVSYYENYVNLKTRMVPLLLAGDDNGRALFTSFHNEAQTTIDMDKILREIVFSL